MTARSPAASPARRGDFQFRNGGDIHGLVSFQTASKAAFVNAGTLHSNLTGGNAFNPVQNLGTITGLVITGCTCVSIVNTGLIGVNVSTAGGSDQIDTRFGTVAGGRFGGPGNDVHRFGADAVTITGATAHGTALVLTTASYALTLDVENLGPGGAEDIDGTGNGSTNIIIGNAGENRIGGRAGADTLNGAEGDDVPRGGSGTDTVTYGGTQSAVAVDLGRTPPSVPIPAMTGGSRSR